MKCQGAVQRMSQTGRLRSQKVWGHLSRLPEVSQALAHQRVWTQQLKIHNRVMTFLLLRAFGRISSFVLEEHTLAVRPLRQAQELLLIASYSTACEATMAKVDQTKVAISRCRKL